MGATDPAKAAQGTIRGDLGIEITENLVHGSDSPESAGRELSWFCPKGSDSPLSAGGVELLDVDEADAAVARHLHLVEADRAFVRCPGIEQEGICAPLPSPCLGRFHQLFTDALTAMTLCHGELLHVCDQLAATHGRGVTPVQLDVYEPQDGTIPLTHENDGALDLGPGLVLLRHRIEFGDPEVARLTGESLRVGLAVDTRDGGSVGREHGPDEQALGHAQVSRRRRRLSPRTGEARPLRCGRRSRTRWTTPAARRPGEPGSARSPGRSPRRASRS